VIREEKYKQRKAYLVNELEQQIIKLSNRAKYILETLDGRVDLRKKSAVQVNELLETRGYTKIDGDYKYLVKMPMDSVTEENVRDILAEEENAKSELQTLKDTTIHQMWICELVTFETEYLKYKSERNNETKSAAKPEQKKVQKKLVLKSPK